MWRYSLISVRIAGDWSLQLRWRYYSQLTWVNAPCASKNITRIHHFSFETVKMCTELHYIVRNTRSITWRCHVARAGLLTWPVRITSWENCLILRYIAEWGGSVFNTPNNTGAGTLDVTMHPVSHLGLLCGMYDVRVTGDFSHVQSSSRDLGYLARAILITWLFD